MKKTSTLIIGILMTGILLAQPGGPQNHHGQFGDRMEMMTIWKLTNYLELTEKQAEKFFPRLRSHQANIQTLHKQERELLDPISQKVKKGDKITKSELKPVLVKLEAINQERSQERTQFINKAGDVLTPTQQAKLMLFKGHMKKQVRGKIKEYQKPRSMRRQKMGGKRRF